ncbi:MAG TPA: GWxTD domain-containing protein, partial [Gemmatimonadaceae bacterium]|nr:GWxTD domain-containing protein [Gemmatimonadaceae bacterium]
MFALRTLAARIVRPRPIVPIVISTTRRPRDARRARARRLALPVVGLALVAVAVACGGSRGGRTTGQGVSPRERTAAAASLTDQTVLYERAGFITSARPVPFIASVKYLAGPGPDSTLVAVLVSMNNRALTFAREGGGYRAGYEVSVDLRREGSVIRHSEAREQVRVPAFRETARGDESILFQQYLLAAPGTYTLLLTVRDTESARTASAEESVTVPPIVGGTLSSPITVYEVTPRVRTDTAPSLIPSPKATVVFGRDTSMAVYLEADEPPGQGGDGPGRIGLAVRNDAGLTLWSDSLTLPRLGSLSSGVLVVPTTRLGVGLVTLAAWRTQGRADTVRTPLFVALSDELAIGSFDEVLSYLRYFTTPERLRALRDTSVAARPTAWIAFLQQTDPVPTTPEHEALRDYFGRVEQANQRFREEGQAGWLTDRGMVYITLGEPDQLFEPGGEGTQRGRAQIWQYSRYRLQLFFVDQSGFGRWRLTPGSESDFQSIARRERSRTAAAAAPAAPPSATPPASPPARRLHAPV